MTLGELEKTIVASYGPGGCCELETEAVVTITLEDLVELFKRMDPKTREGVLKALQSINTTNE
ncbi:MAG: hypothetical protein QXK45_07585 [Thermofilaceae archaeon]